MIAMEPDARRTGHKLQQGRRDARPGPLPAAPGKAPVQRHPGAPKPEDPWPGASPGGLHRLLSADVPGLVSLGEEGLLKRYQAVVLPQAQIAFNQGFEVGWRWKN